MFPDISGPIYNARSVFKFTITNKRKLWAILLGLAILDRHSWDIVDYLHSLERHMLPRNIPFALAFAACSSLGLMSALDAGAVTIESGPVLNEANGHTYYLLSSDTWSASNAFAQSLGGTLVTINDVIENAWVSDTFTANGTVNRALWIGLNDVAQEGVWSWASGESVTYLGWDIGQPNGAFGWWDEDYAHFWGTTGYGGNRYVWNDYLDGSLLDGHLPLHGVVEISPTPVPGPAPIVSIIAAIFGSRRIRAIRGRPTN